MWLTPTIKTLDTRLGWVSQVDNILCALLHIRAGRIRHCSHSSTRREQLVALSVLGLSCTLHYAPFLVDFNLYSFTVVNCNHEYNSFSDFSSSSELLNFRVILRFYQITACQKYRWSPMFPLKAIILSHLVL